MNTSTTTTTTCTAIPPSPLPPTPLPTFLVVLLALGGVVILAFSFRACYNIKKSWGIYRGYWKVENEETDDLERTMTRIDRAAAEVQHPSRVVPPRSRLGEPRPLDRTIASYFALKYLNRE